ncbi:hypothetical protein TESG_05992 [Trichophyton tonsurans CBS 112818]|uniref:Uncharacterized protein n=1 Tax=Trichophyton tonsurans (strain CBS 112818) TaxID=647933 RepID=F2S566_TRIT1|nr:hypothetical protein TESG_05992 [Trichophyton tonsurans CBS 112818]
MLDLELAGALEDVDLLRAAWLQIRRSCGGLALALVILDILILLPDSWPAEQPPSWAGRLVGGSTALPDAPSYMGRWMRTGPGCSLVPARFYSCQAGLPVSQAQAQAQAQAQDEQRRRAQMMQNQVACRWCGRRAGKAGKTGKTGKAGKGIQDAPLSTANM